MSKPTWRPTSYQKPVFYPQDTLVHGLNWGRGVGRTECALQYLTYEVSKGNKGLFVYDTHHVNELGRRMLNKLSDCKINITGRIITELESQRTFEFKTPSDVLKDSIMTYEVICFDVNDTGIDTINRILTKCKGYRKVRVFLPKLIGLGN